MQLFKKIRLYLVVFIYSLNAFGQEYLSTNITTNDGLPNNSIYSVFKDSRGILWIGTDNGVSKSVNGRIINYTTSNGLAHNSCWSITEDKNHHLWFGSHGGGITFYDGSVFRVINAHNGLINEKVRKLYVRKNHVFVGTENGVSVIDIRTRKVLFSKKIIGKLKKFQVMDFFEYRSKIFFSTFSDGVWGIDIKKGKITRQYTQFEGAFSVFQKDQNTLLVCHGDTRNKSICEYRVSNYILGNQSSSSYGSTIFWNFIKDKKGRIFSAGNGVNFSTGGLFEIINNKAVNVSSLFGVNSTEVWSLFYDKTNDILYVGTIDKGLFIVNLNSNIEYFSPTYFKLDEIEIIGFEKIKSKQVILHRKGVFFIENKKILKELTAQLFLSYIQRFRQIKDYERNFSYYYLFKKAKLASVEFRKVFKFQDKLWINSSIGLFALDYTGEIVDYFAIDAEAYFMDKPSYYQVSFGRSYVLKNKEGKISNEQLKNRDSKALLNDNCNVSSIFKWENKIYFVSAHQGIFTWDGIAFDFTHQSKKWKEIVFSNWLKNHQLLLANRLGDVILLDLNEHKEIRQINNSDIIGNTIIFVDKFQDEIIIGTNKGINIIYGKKHQFISNKVGLLGNVLLTGKVLEHALYLGTLNGFFTINLHQLQRLKKKAPQLKIKHIEVNYSNIADSAYRWGFYQSKEICLPYDKNNLSISFDILGVKPSEEFLFRYRLINKGLQKWSKWSSNKTINFVFIPSGKHHLEIQTKNQFTGQINFVPLLAIQIDPPFWKTWIFIISTTASSILLFLLILRSRIIKYKQRETFKSGLARRIAETKMEALQSQMNPHFIFNAMNSIQNFVIDNKTDDALKYIGEFSKLIRQTLEFSSKQTVTLDEEIAYLERYIALENLRRNNPVFHVITKRISDTPNHIEIPPLLIQPLIENVFIHAFDSQSKEPKIEINFDCKDDEIACTISDNGKGFSKDSGSKQSKGIKLVDERIRLLTGVNEKLIQIQQNRTGGSIIVLTIPMR